MTPEDDRQKFDERSLVKLRPKTRRLWFDARNAIEDIEARNISEAMEDIEGDLAKLRKKNSAIHLAASVMFKMSAIRVRVPRLNLEHIALLVMTIDQADERLGDLDEKRKIIKGRHGVGYARFWYAWTGFWLIVVAAFGKLPGKRLLDALISKMAAKS